MYLLSTINICLFVMQFVPAKDECPSERPGWAAKREVGSDLDDFVKWKVH